MAGPPGSATHLNAPAYLQALRPMSLTNSAKFDEGYSEDTRSQSEGDTVMRSESRLGDIAMDPDMQYALPEWVLQMTENDRSDFAYAILRSLRTSSIAAIVNKLSPLLHLDPVMHLPPEITFEIFSYLTPETLLQASTLSRAWRSRVMDSPLWKLLFQLEGWAANAGQVVAYEEAERQRLVEFKEKERNTRPRVVENTEGDKPSTKRRLREHLLFGEGTPENGIHNKLEPLSLDHGRDRLPSWGEQHGAVEADDGLAVRSDDRMEGISYNNGSSPVASPTRESSLRRKRSSEAGDELAAYTAQSLMDPPLRVSLILPSPQPKVNWQFLYKQKRRLEENWDAGRFTNFQLPHPNHPREAHTECVYTIQYSGKHLVSGSRDKTLRVWDLDTQRLRHPPLVGHTASVLCLQFDERPEQDIIISAGSDCRVIIWQFSTGRLIKQIERAHSESVLNLRFDDTYLATCSKDKTIKIWNRKELLPTDDAYPSTTTRSGARFPSYIINMQKQVESQHLQFKPLQPYTLIMTLEGHGAAVNAIQILDGQIVSASGDRNIKVWDIRTGACSRTLTGHNKGIACVQFDGRRIVSGSSDETVRIFDRATGAEVACLQGHTNLVRTVQAQFGDLAGNEEELEAEARAVDSNFFEAQRQGLIPEEMSRAQRRARNAGSRDPKAIFAYGAKLPPGGGGSKWARIVSGSYDETIIIWKRGVDGAWEKSKVLYQSEAVKAAGGRPRRPVVHAHHAHHTNQAQTQQQPAVQTPAPEASTQQAPAQAHSAQNVSLPAASTGIQNTTNGTIGTIGHNIASANQTHTAGAQGQAAQAPHAANGPAGAAAQHHHHHPGHHHHHPPMQSPPSPQGTSRVFKLQFDARRIVCCSQDPTIVGWDFANNDKDIVLASQFFGSSA